MRIAVSSDKDEPVARLIVLGSRRRVRPAVARGPSGRTDGAGNGRADISHVEESVA